ncbi:6,7-dimethyl-8-ribityllumazine synthase [Patescibacteria group bacterium]|nr:6,7-dimethyl-8-ribityllumazine synthase [Patescibacteria group bacterium]
MLSHKDQQATYEFLKERKSSGNLDGSKLKIAVILSRFNDHIGNTLLEKVLENLPNEPKVYRVPGALEIPLTALLIAKKYDVIIALGVIIKGDTAHFDIVCNESARGIMKVSLKTRTPIINGVLTCYTEEQALKRAKIKGKEFAESAIEMGTLKI